MTCGFGVFSSRDLDANKLRVLGFALKQSEGEFCGGLYLGFRGWGG